MASVVEEKDVVIIGAGISGIDSAYRIQTETDLSFTVLESRHEIGGTWSLFQFPGIRSDSDMFTLGFPFRPWTSKRAIADGADILQYVKDTAAEFGIDKKIQFQSKVSEASWSSKEARWTLKVSSPKNEIREVKARFVMFASGYYDYDEGFYPTLPGAKNFEGPIVQPQWWPKGLQYQGKRVIVIGSGATAVTIVPNMAQQGAAHVTMLQRSPSYILSVPGENKLANKIRSIFPRQVAHTCLRVINTLGAGLLTSTSHWFPNYVRKLVMGQARKQLPPGYEVEKHFNPSYNPWDQRMCLVPDGDFYEKIREGKVSVATGHIQEITRNAIKLQDGQELQADIIVQATGLKLKMFGGALITIDGDKFNVNEHYCYRGQMIEGIPNASMSFGYVDASWTLGADLCARYMTRLLNYMKKNGYSIATPHLGNEKLNEGDFLSLKSGYVLRAKNEIPKSSDRWPWSMRKSAFLDWLRFSFDPVAEGMKFEKSGPAIGEHYK